MTFDEPELGDDLVRLASADNFRDVAGVGYATRGGGRVRTGFLFRSNELQLTGEDASALRDLGITAVFDLRELHEVEAHPDVPVPGATWQHLEVTGIPPGVGAELADRDAAVSEMLVVYRRFVTDAAARTSFGTLIGRLAEADTPLLFHCTAGKDRTGWASALLLHVAGVPHDVVLADYLLTNTVSSRTRDKYLGLVREHLGEDRVPIFERVMVAEAAYLQAAYDAATETYGSLDGYLTQGLGLNETVLAELRATLVAPAGHPATTAT